MFAGVLPTVARTDLQRYSGRWFEIARLPMHLQSDDCTDLIVDYTLQPGNRMLVRNECLLPDGRICISHGVAWPKDGTHARLRVSYMREGLRWLPFTARRRWILRLDHDYTMSLVGTPGRRRLWLLARTRTPDPAMRDDFLAYAASIGFDLTALIHTQHARPGIDAPHPLRHA